MRSLPHFRFILRCLSEALKPGPMFQFPNPIRQQQSKATGVGVACSARGRSPYCHYHDGSRSVVTVSTTTADQPRAGVSFETVSRWKRVESTGNSVGSSRVGGSFTLSIGGVSPPVKTPFSSCGSLATTTSKFSSHATTSSQNSTQRVSTLTSFSTSGPSHSTCVVQTPFNSTPSETLMTTSATLPSSSSSSASPILSSSSLSSSMSTDPGGSATSFPPAQSTVTVSTVPLSPPPSSPSFTMSDPDTITLAPVDPTSTVIDSTNVPDTTQSESETTQVIVSSISSTSFVIPTPTFLSSIFFPPTSSTPDFLTSIASPYPSISAISLSSIPADYPTVTPTTVTPTRTSVGTQTSTVSSVVPTGVLSTDTPRNAGFAHQTGAIVGIVLGGTFALLLMILLIFFACKRHRSNRSYGSSMEDILALSRTPWRPPLEGDDDEHYLAAHGHSPSYPKTLAIHGEGGYFGDRLSIKGNGGRSTESADPNGAWPVKAVFGGQPQTLLGSTNPRDPSIFPSYSYNGHGDSYPWWGNTEPLHINKRNSSQQLPDTYVSAVRNPSASSLGCAGGSSSNGHHYGPGSSGEALLPSGSARSTSIPGPKPTHVLSGRRHYSTPPTAFLRDPGLEYGAQRIRQHQEEQKHQDRVDKSISQIILARIRASRRISTATTAETYTTIRSEESTPSRAPSYIYSPSLLNPPIALPQTVPGVYLPRGVTGYYTPDNTLNQHLHHRQGVGDISEGFHLQDVRLPPAPSPVPTDTSSMVEGLLHPRLGMALAPSQRASAMSLRDHEDYTRPINGLVNNHIRSTTTLQDNVDSGE